MPFINPFKRRDGAVHTAEVLVPLAEGNPPKADADAEKDKGETSSEEKGVSPAPSQYTSLTMEALRAEVESDIATSGHDSSYDRMFVSSWDYY